MKLLLLLTAFTSLLFVSCSPGKTPHSNDFVTIYYDIDTKVWMEKDKDRFLEYMNPLVAENAKMTSGQVFGIYGKSKNLTDYPYLVLIHKRSPSLVPDMDKLAEMLGGQVLSSEDLKKRTASGAELLFENLQMGKPIFDKERKMMLITSSNTTAGRNIEKTVATFFRGYDIIGITASYESGKDDGVLQEFQRLVDDFSWDD